MSYLNQNQKETFKKFLLSTAVIGFVVCSSSGVLAMDNEDITGAYMIKVCAVKKELPGNERAIVTDSNDPNVGLLSIAKGKSRNVEKFYQNENSPSGHHVQVLTNEEWSALREASHSYIPGAANRNNILWKITRAENGAYTIKNISIANESDPNVGLLSISSSKYSPSGNYVQILNDSPVSAYHNEPYEKDKYLLTAPKRKNILWDIKKENSNSYRITNCSIRDTGHLWGCGNLTWTSEEASSGRYTQVLSEYPARNAFTEYYERYLPYGRSYYEAVWELIPVNENIVVK